ASSLAITARSTRPAARALAMAWQKSGRSPRRRRFFLATRSEVPLAWTKATTVMAFRWYAGRRPLGTRTREGRRPPRARARRRGGGAPTRAGRRAARRWGDRRRRGRRGRRGPGDRRGPPAARRRPPARDPP